MTIKGTVFSVSELTQLLKTAISNTFPGELWVQGEVSNFRAPASGHLYFTLKDEKSTLRCVMFRSRAVRLRYEPEDGMAVLARGRLGVYEPAGQYQLYVEALEPVGRGALQVAFEQLKARLEKEGLFSAEHKKELPKWPQVVGVVTSKTGAAIRDIVQVVSQRWPLVQILLSPATVQGMTAPESIASALKLLDQSRLADVIIVGRGGGSVEELAAFNTETVARAIFQCQTPVVAAVGHEIDYTIADFVADARAATPSAAAALVTPDRVEMKRTIRELNARLESAIRGQVNERRQALTVLRDRLAAREPAIEIDRLRQYTDELLARGGRAVLNRLEGAKRELAHLSGRLQAASPLAIMGRGYAVVRRDETSSVVRSASQLQEQEIIRVSFCDGEVKAQVRSVHPGEVRDIDRLQEGEISGD